MYYLNASDGTEYMGSTAALYGIAGFCRAFFVVFTLTTLFYHYAKKFRLYIVSRIHEKIKSVGIRRKLRDG